MGNYMINPKDHPDWLAPHSLDWYAQLGNLTGEYEYPWGSTIMEQDGESLFADEVARMVPNQIVLDIGCGHGAFTLRWSRSAKKLVGVDVTDDFLHTAEKNKTDNVTFVRSNTKIPLPFAKEEFDCAYNRRGPTSAYPDCKRIVKAGGKILGLHPGDNTAAEFSEWFPALFDPRPKGTPILDNLKHRLEQSDFSQAEIQIVECTEYVHTPLDVIKMRCFGQKPSVFQIMLEGHLSFVQKVFEKHADEKGLPTTFSRYIVRASV